MTAWSSCQLVSPFARSRCGIFTVHWCLTQVKEEVAFAGPDSVLSIWGTCEACSTRPSGDWVGGWHCRCLYIAELVAEGLRCDVGEDEVTFLIVIFVHTDS